MLNVTQHNDTQHKAPLCWMPIFCCYTESHKTEHCYAGCLGAILVISSSRESLLKGVDQYGWPPQTNQFRSAAFHTEKSFYKTSYHKEGINCIEPIPLARLPWSNLPGIVRTGGRSSSSFHLRCTSSFLPSSKAGCTVTEGGGGDAVEIGPLKRNFKVVSYFEDRLRYFSILSNIW